MDIQTQLGVQQEPAVAGEPRTRVGFGFSSTGTLVVLMVGLLLVIMARGCDSMGARSVARSQAYVLSLKNAFDAEWEPKQTALNSDWNTRQEALDSEWDAKKAEIDQLPDSPDKSIRLSQYSSDRERAQAALKSDREKAENNFKKDQQKAKDKAEREWQGPQFEARNAAASLVMKSYWYEMVFVLGSIILCIGILAAARTGTPAERVMGLVMLCIILVSLYIAGAPWLTSVVNTVKGVTT